MYSVFDGGFGLACNWTKQKNVNTSKAAGHIGNTQSPAIMKRRRGVEKVAEQKKQAQQPNQTQEQDLNQLLKVRREKLAELQADGKDPFKITKYDVSDHSSDIRENF